jgi:transposase
MAWEVTMPRLAPIVELDTEQRGALEARVRARTSEQRIVERARIVLLAAEGLANKEIAERLSVDPDTVGKWRSRFTQEGLVGLEDRPRPGRRPVYGHDDRLKIIKTVTEEPPDPASHWSGRQVAESLAGDVGISRSQVWRILDDLDLKPHRVRSWLTSRDPEFWEKAADVCGLYLDPPEGALVLSVDEKTGMQAKSRVNPTKPARPGSPARHEFEYRRHGTACLFAALDVHSGEIVSATKRRNRSEEFIEFLERLDAVTPDDLVLHLILDNGPSHVSKKTREWLADDKREERFVVHHTPTHASWLNQIELFFSILGRRLLRRGEFASIDELVTKVVAFIEDYNRQAKPFRWTYQGKPLKAT